MNKLLSITYTGKLKVAPMAIMTHVTLTVEETCIVKLSMVTKMTEQLATCYTEPVKITMASNNSSVLTNMDH
jgi:hypothetical protein